MIWMRLFSVQVLAVAIACCTGCYAAASFIRQAQGATPARSAQVVAPPVAEVPAEALAVAFSVLRGSASLDDKAPAAARAMVAGTDSQSAVDGRFGPRTSYGINDALSRRVGEVGDSAAFLVPGSTGACLFTARPDGHGLSCSAADDVAQEGIMATQRGASAEERRILGVVPDGISLIRISTLEGRTADVATADNGFAVDVRGTPDRVAWLDRHGREVRSLSVP